MTASGGVEYKGKYHYHVRNGGFEMEYQERNDPDGGEWWARGHVDCRSRLVVQNRSHRLNERGDEMLEAHH